MPQIATSSYAPTPAVVKPSKPLNGSSAKALWKLATGATKPAPKKPAHQGLVVHDLTEINVAHGVRTLLATESRDAAVRDCRRKVEKISRECRLDNAKYRDPHFDLSSMPAFCLKGLKPVPASGDNDADDDDDEDDDENLPADCKRVGDLFDEPKFIVDGIDAHDIKQGSAGDCWFLAAVATIANMPTLLESICVARDEQVGVYGFIFFRDGEWISEVIDDQLFVSNPSYAEAPDHVKGVFATEQAYVEALQRGSRALHFAKCADSNETWLPLMEKAFAKAHGDYAAIEGGFTGEGVEDLTGGVTTEVITADILDRERFWNEELTQVNKELLFACAISGVAASSVQGLITGHAYSVLKAVEVKGQRLVQVRNPWGASEWTGKWSDGSSEWTAEWMTLLDHKFGDDGAFWMTYSDFLSTFTDLDRTRVFSSEWTVSQAWTKCEVAWPAAFAEQQFSLTLSRAGPVVIVLQQSDSRYFTGLSGQYDFRLHMRVHREGESEYFARSKQTLMMTRSVNKELHLEAGTWIVSFRVARQRNGLAPISTAVETYMNQQSDKFLAVARNYDYALAKGVVQEQEWEDEEDDDQEVEEEPAMSDDEAAAGEDEDEQLHEEAADDDEEEVEPVAVVGIRIHAKDPELQVSLVVDPDVVHEMDPDDSSVTAFLSTATDKSAFLSHCVRD